MSEENDNPLKIAEQLRREVANIDLLSNREEILNKLKEVFIASRLESASKQEQLKEAALNELLNRINTTTSTRELMRIIELMNENTTHDLNALLGVAKGGGITINNNSNINDNRQEANIFKSGISSKESSSNQIEKTGYLLEAMSTIEQELSDGSILKTIKDLEGVEITKKEIDE